MGERRTLYAMRPVLNGADIIEWARGQGFAQTLTADDLHVTVAFSRTPLEWPEPAAEAITIPAQADRVVKPLGDKGAVVLGIRSPTLEGRWQAFRALGASWDWDGYQPHVSITYQGAGVDLSRVEPYGGPIELGPERFAEVNEDWSASVTEKVDLHGQITKADDEQRMAWGWASVISEKGTPVVDLQGDVIEPDELVKATTEFMADVRTAKAMHQGGQVGEVLHSLPLTKELAAAFGIESEREGWTVGMKIHDDAIWAAVKDGTLRAFSIGGGGTREEIT